MKSVPEKIREVLAEHDKWVINNVEHGIYIPLEHPEATQAILSIIKEDVIGEDEEHVPVEELGIWGHDIARYEYNHLRAKQRAKLKGDK